jgi:hypothetical protein
VTTPSLASPLPLGAGDADVTARLFRFPVSRSPVYTSGNHIRATVLRPRFQARTVVYFWADALGHSANFAAGSSMLAPFRNLALPLKEEIAVRRADAIDLLPRSIAHARRFRNPFPRRRAFVTANAPPTGQ